jgi:CheY-like chemotaxis protein
MSKPHPYVVIVDDDDDEAYVMNIAFSEIGWSDHVTYFSTSDDLFAFLKNLPEAAYPSLVVLDYNMPKINGFEALYYLKNNEKYKDIAISVYSTSMSGLLKSQLTALGAHSCYTKMLAFSGAVQLATTFKEIAEGVNSTY